MKLILAVIQPPKLEAVRGPWNGSKSPEPRFAMPKVMADSVGTRYPTGGMNTPPDFCKTALEIVVNDDFLERTIRTLIDVARTGAEGVIGDGKIFVLPVEEVIQIDDGTRGPGAV